MQNKKIVAKGRRGFTLIEILLVLVIIGILASVVFAMIGNSDNAKLKATLSTAKSVLTYAQECSFKGNTLTEPTDTHNGGDPICSDSDSNWPGLSVSDCDYSVTGDYTYEVNCTSIDDKYIKCDAINGYCREADVAP